MAYVRIKGLPGRHYVPDDAGPKKHDCEDCFSCQMCSDDRCQLCRGPKSKNSRGGCCKKKKKRKAPMAQATD